MSYSRSIRRHHRMRLWNKRKRYHNGWPLEGSRKGHIVRDTPAICSCIMCSRSKWRHEFGEVTRQELVAGLDASEQLTEVAYEIRIPPN